MSTYSLSNFVWDASLFTSGLYLATKFHQPVRSKPVKAPTKQELQYDITKLKNLINTTEIIVKNYEETIKTVRRELEEALKVLREENSEEVTVKNKIEQLDKLERFRDNEKYNLEYLKKDLKKVENQLKNFEIDESE